MELRGVFFALALAGNLGDDVVGDRLGGRFRVLDHLRHGPFFALGDVEHVVARDVDVRAALRAQEGVGLDAVPLRLPERGRLLRNVGAGDARRPDDGVRLPADGVLADAVLNVPVPDGGDACPERDRDAHFAQPSLRLGGELRREGGDRAVQHVDVDNLHLVAVDLELVAQHRDPFGELAGHLHPREARAGDVEREHLPAFFGVRLRDRALEPIDDVVPEPDGVVQRPQAVGELVGAGNPEIDGLGAGGQHQVIVPVAAVSAGQRPGVVIDGSDGVELHVHAAAREDALETEPDAVFPDAVGGDLLYLREHGVVRVPVNQRDFDAGLLLQALGQLLRSQHPGEPGAQHNDFFSHGSHSFLSLRVKAPLRARLIFCRGRRTERTVSFPI